jgi:hypothetical protein
VTSSASCTTAESAAKAVDGSLTSNSKWCSSAAGTRSLTVDLGANASVSAFAVKHAGLGGENTGLNTGAYTIETSTDGSSFSQAASLSGNRSSRTFHALASARTARYVRLNVTSGINSTGSGADAARIYEFEVYGSGGGGLTNVAQGKPATGSAPCAAAEGPEKAVNGSVGGGNGDKWCSSAASAFLQVDLGSSRAIKSFTVRHASAGGESATFNTRDFDIDVSDDGTTWTTAVQARGNTAGASDHPVTVTGRYIRLRVITGQQSGSNIARIYEFEAYA